MYSFDGNRIKLYNIIYILEYIVYVRYLILFYTDKVGLCNVLMVIELSFKIYYI